VQIRRFPPASEARPLSLSADRALKSSCSTTSSLSWGPKTVSSASTSQIKPSTVSSHVVRLSMISSHFSYLIKLPDGTSAYPRICMRLIGEQKNPALRPRSRDSDSRRAPRHGDSALHRNLRRCWMPSRLPLQPYAPMHDQQLELAFDGRIRTLIHPHTQNTGNRRRSFEFQVSFLGGCWSGVADNPS
jgi:hypothetical protein